MEVIVCAKGSKGYFNSGVVLGRSSGSSVATALKISYLDGSTSTNASIPLSAGVCTAVQIDAVDATGRAGYVSNARNVTVSVSDTATSRLYYDEACQSAGVSSAPITSFYGNVRLYLKSSLAPTSPVSV
ncbi:MAG: hypothetical protein EON59_14580, partial [Alphaproteobacteria bacterium]